MKLVKTYEDFRLHDNDFDKKVDSEDAKTIEEICYDLTDDGYDVIVGNSEGHAFALNGINNYIQIRFPVPFGEKTFSYNDVHDTIDRLVIYLGKRLIKICIFDNGWFVFNWFDIRREDSTKKTPSFVIWFK